MRMPSRVKIALGLDFDGSFMSMVMESPLEPIPLYGDMLGCPSTAPSVVVYAMVWESCLMIASM